MQWHSAFYACPFWFYFCVYWVNTANVTFIFQILIQCVYLMTTLVSISRIIKLLFSVLSLCAHVIVTRLLFNGQTSADHTHTHTHCTFHPLPAVALWEPLHLLDLSAAFMARPLLFTSLISSVSVTPCLLSPWHPLQLPSPDILSSSPTSNTHSQNT